jgi:hypothetical protein
VQDLDLELAILLGADGAQVDIWDIGNFVRGERLGGFVNLVRDALGRWGTVREVVLDAEVLGGTYESQSWCSIIS